MDCQGFHCRRVSSCFASNYFTDSDGDGEEEKREKTKTAVSIKVLTDLVASVIVPLLFSCLCAFVCLVLSPLCNAMTHARPIVVVFSLVCTIADRGYK